MKLSALFRTASMTMFCVFSLSALVPAEVRAARVSAALTDTLSRYSEARKAYVAKGPAAFVESIGGLPKIDREFLVARLQGLEPMPELNNRGEDTVELAVDGKIHSFRVVDASLRRFEINGRAFEYQNTQSLEKNAARIEKLLQQPRASWLRRSLVPRAEAWISIAIVAVIFGLLGYMVGNYTTKKKLTEEHARERDEYERDRELTGLREKVRELEEKLRAGSHSQPPPPAPSP